MEDLSLILEQQFKQNIPLEPFPQRKLEYTSKDVPHAPKRNP